MAFTVGDTTQTYQENCLNTDESHVCCHLMLEELGVPEDDAECAHCSNHWVQRLTEVVEQTEDHYTTSYHCIAEGG